MFRNTSNGYQMPKKSERDSQESVQLVSQLMDIAGRRGHLTAQAEVAGGRGGAGGLLSGVGCWITLTCMRTFRDTLESGPRRHSHECKSGTRRLSLHLSTHLPEANVFLIQSNVAVATGTIFRVKRGSSHSYSTVCIPDRKDVVIY